MNRDIHVTLIVGKCLKASFASALSLCMPSGYCYCTGFILLGKGKDSEEAILHTRAYPRGVILPQDDSATATHKLYLKIRILRGFLAGVG